MALLSAFAFNRTLTVNTTSGGANIAGSLTDFPVCVVVNSASWASVPRGHFFDSSNTAGKRVQFYSGATSLAYEVEQYDGSGQAAVYWVKVPTVTGNSTTVITVGYGNDPNGSAQDAATSVWDASYKTVMHLSDGTTLSVADSTSNANNGTNSNGAAAVGMADGGVSFDAATKRIAVVGGPSGSNARTIEGWVKTSSTGTGVMYDQGQVATGKRFLIYNAATNGPVKLEFNGSTGTGTATTIRNGAWHHFAGVLTGTTANSALLYVDGASDALTFANGANVLNTTATPLFLNSNVDGNTVGNIGTYDEFRISSVARAAGWVRASYFSLKTTSWPGDGWLTLGTEVTSARSGSGSDALTIAESGAGRKGGQGSGADALTLVESVSGRKATSGSGSDAVAFTESALGEMKARGQGSETLTFSEAQAGRKAGYGSATEGPTFAETASGAIALAGAGAEAVAFSEAADGRKQGRGAGSDALTFSEAGSGDIFAAGQGSISSVFTEVASGVKAAAGSGSDAVAFSEAADGSQSPSGTGTITVAFAEAATGAQDAPAEEHHFGSTVVHIRRDRRGSGAEDVRLSLRAAGRKGSVGSVSDALSFAADGTGRKGIGRAGATTVDLSLIAGGMVKGSGRAIAPTSFSITGEGRRDASGRSHLALVFSMEGTGIGIEFHGSGAKIGHGSGALAVVYSGAAEGVGDHVDENRQKAEDELLMVLAA